MMQGDLTTARYAAYQLRHAIENGTPAPDDMADLVESLGGKVELAGNMDPRALAFYLITLILTAR